MISFSMNFNIPLRNPHPSREIDRSTAYEHNSETQGHHRHDIPLESHITFQKMVELSNGKS